MALAGHLNGWFGYILVMAYIVMALAGHLNGWFGYVPIYALANTLILYPFDMVYIVMTCVDMVHMVMGYVVMAYIVTRLYSHGIHTKLWPMSI